MLVKQPLQRRDVSAFGGHLQGVPLRDDLEPAHDPALRHTQVHVGTCSYRVRFTRARGKLATSMCEPGTCDGGNPCQCSPQPRYRQRHIEQRIKAPAKGETAHLWWDVLLDGPTPAVSGLGVGLREKERENKRQRETEGGQRETMRDREKDR